jgi:hypothetical protein
MKHSITFLFAAVLSLNLAQADPAPGTDSATQGANQITAIAGSLIDQVQKHQKDYSKKASDLMKRTEDLLDLQEAQAKRFGKILDTWERQQQEYQAYLDTLPKSPAPKPAAPAN